jgi:hypothetical protein
MNQTKDFVEGIAFALQSIYDFEKKHGHLPLDSTAANAISISIRDYAIVFFQDEFTIVCRRTPYGEIFIAGLI